MPDISMLTNPVSFAKPENILVSQSSKEDLGAPIHILLTGATGFMGRATLKVLLDEFPCAHIHAIVRPPKCGNPAARSELAQFAAHPRVHFLAGDMGQLACGLMP